MSEVQRTPRQAAAAPHPDDQGHSAAAWTLVTIVLVGSLISAAALVANQHWMFWTGLGVMVLGAIVGKVMQVMGFGVKVYEQSPTDPGRAQGVR